MFEIDLFEFNNCSFEQSIVESCSLADSSQDFGVSGSLASYWILSMLCGHA